MEQQLDIHGGKRAGWYDVHQERADATRGANDRDTLSRSNQFHEHAAVDGAKPIAQSLIDPTDLATIGRTSEQPPGNTEPVFAAAAAEEQRDGDSLNGSISAIYLLRQFPVNEWPSSAAQWKQLDHLASIGAVPPQRGGAQVISKVTRHGLHVQQPQQADMIAAMLSASNIHLKVDPKFIR